KQGKRENQANGSKVVCYNCRGEGHVAIQCKEPKRARNSQWYADKALLLNAQEKGEVLDAEAEAFLADELHQEEGIESDNESLPKENTIPYSKHMASNDEHPSGSYLHIPASTFLDLNAQITCLYKVNEERNQTLEAKTQTINTLTTELEWYKLKVEQLDKNRVKHELEMALAERKKRSNELEEENI
nr:hypothetical protein [Tanacetum cinerariifolium]